MRLRAASKSHKMKTAGKKPSWPSWRPRGVLPSALLTLECEIVHAQALTSVMPRELEREEECERLWPVSSHTRPASQLQGVFPAVVLYVQRACTAILWGALDPSIENAKLLKQPPSPQRLCLATHSSHNGLAAALPVCVRWCASRTDMTL